MSDIPTHLLELPWYPAHLAWLRSRGIHTRHNPGDAVGTRADLRGANLRGANLREANLSEADLSGADLPDTPVVPNIDAAIHEAVSREGCELDMGDWHTCATTHCRAGWAVVLAGEEGRRLEEKIGPNAAGSLIYAVSRPGKPVPNWFDSNSNVMAELSAAAAAEGGEG